MSKIITLWIYGNDIIDSETGFSTKENVILIKDNEDDNSYLIKYNELLLNLIHIV